jgi:hypothetical protein
MFLVFVNPSTRDRSRGCPVDVSSAKAPSGAFVFAGIRSHRISSCRHLAVPWGSQLNRSFLQGSSFNPEETQMAITHHQEVFCKFDHVENGKMIPRRIQCMIVQAPDGRVYEMRGKQLPDHIVLMCGNPQEGNLLHILLKAPPRKTITAFVAEFLNGTRARDLAFILVGMFLMNGFHAVYAMLLRLLEV